MSAHDAPLKIEYVPVSRLRPFEGNPRTISERGLEKLQRSIEEFGFVNPILVQKGTYMVIAGHQRLKAAQEAGLTEVPVIALDMDDITAKAYNIADNRLQDESDWDFSALADLLSELDNGAVDLELTGFDHDEIERMMTWAPEPQMASLSDLQDYGEKDAETMTIVVHVGQGEELRERLKRIAEDNPDPDDIAPLGWALEQAIVAYERWKAGRS